MLDMTVPHCSTTHRRQRVVQTNTHVHVMGVNHSASAHTTANLTLTGAQADIDRLAALANGKIFQVCARMAAICILVCAPH